MPVLPLPFRLAVSISLASAMIMPLAACGDSASEEELEPTTVTSRTTVLETASRPSRDVETSERTSPKKRRESDESANSDGDDLAPAVSDDLEQQSEDSGEEPSPEVVDPRDMNWVDVEDFSPEYLETAPLVGDDAGDTVEGFNFDTGERSDDF